jgi:glycosyltransferase involved in cell wall biosynthesis
MISVIVPYYNQRAMLHKQIDTWRQYAPHVLSVLRFIVVDDGSPVPAEFVSILGTRLYRIDIDIPWNRAGARNLGATVAETEWLLQMDTDHILPPDAAEALVGRLNDYSKKTWYRFRRFRVGAADETRMKDKIPREQRFGEIKPHIDSYLCTREMYWKAGGYNEDFSGCLGGGSPFLRELEKVGGKPRELPPDTFLHVHTRDSVPDASASLDRDRSEYKRRSEALTRAGKIKGHPPYLRFPWHRVL